MFCMLYAFFWVIPRRLEFNADVSEHSCLFHLHRQVWRWNRQSVPKRRHINSRRRGIIQNKAYNIMQFSSHLCLSSFSVRHTILNLTTQHYYVPRPLCPNIFPNNFLSQKMSKQFLLSLRGFCAPQKREKLCVFCLHLRFIWYLKLF